MSEERKRKTLADIEQELVEMSENESGAPKLGALKALAAMKTADLTIAPPMSDDELVIALGRLMKGAGRGLTMTAFKWAFPRNLAAGERSVALLRKYDAATPEMRLAAKRITSLKMLNREFPEIKQEAGLPVGYPRGKSNAAKIAWCQEQALRCLVERDNNARKEALVELTEGNRDVEEAGEDRVPEPELS